MALSFSAGTDDTEFLQTFRDEEQQLRAETLAKIFLDREKQTVTKELLEEQIRPRLGLGKDKKGQ